MLGQNQPSQTPPPTTAVTPLLQPIRAEDDRGVVPTRGTVVSNSSQAHNNRYRLTCKSSLHQGVLPLPILPMLAIGMASIGMYLTATYLCPRSDTGCVPRSEALGNLGKFLVIASGFVGIASCVFWPCRRSTDADTSQASNVHTV
jgi:hypothetical protein